MVSDIDISGGFWLGLFFFFSSFPAFLYQVGVLSMLKGTEEVNNTTRCSKNQHFHSTYGSNVESKNPRSKKNPLFIPLTARMGVGFTTARTKGGRWDKMHCIALVALVESLTAAGQPSAAAGQYGKVGRSEIFPRTVWLECVERIFYFLIF